MIETMKKCADLDWFQAAGMGMFIHWGIYALPARGEWVKSKEKMNDEQYDRYFKFFEPDLFEPEVWAERAKNAGMKYVVFTAKHHDGFCMWDATDTDYNSVKAPRCKRDLLRGVVDAFRKAGLRIGIYYSLPDWHHPGYVVDARHPLRENLEASAAVRDYDSYTGYLHRQVRQLLENYGPVDIIWFDGSYPETEKYWKAGELAVMIRSIQPGIIIVRLPGFEDLATPEQHIPQNGVRDIDGRLLPWEGCQVISAGTWGYYRDNKIWKNVRTVAEMLVRHVSRGGNLLLNLAPTSRGCFDKLSTNVLEDLAEWMKFHKRAIHNCTVAPEAFPEPEGCRYTYNPAEKLLYLHFLAWPDQRIFLDKMAQRIEYAQFLHDGSEVHMAEYDPINTHTARIPRGAEMLSLPVERPDTAVPVIELFLK